MPNLDAPTDLAGSRAVALDALIEICGRTASQPGGAIVFISGEPGSGRSALLMAARRELQRSYGERVIGGSLFTGRYVPWLPETSGIARAADAGEKLLNLGAPFLPLVALVQQLVAMAHDAQGLLDDVLTQAQGGNEGKSLSRLLRSAAEGGPLVCLLDDADRCEGGVWLELIGGLANEITIELPLVLVMTMEAPTTFGPQDGQETGSLYVARRLRDRGQALWWPLEPLDVEQTRAWLGPMDRRLASSLCELTGGNARWLAELWDDWKIRHVVQRGGSGWEFVPNRMDAALAPVRDALVRRLEKTLPHDDARALDDSVELLGCAAYEGMRFTAEAVSAALHQPLDTTLHMLTALSPNSDAGQTTAFVTPEPLEGGEDVPTRRRYRFVNHLDWLTLRRYAIPAERCPALCRDLAYALEQNYVTDRHLVARTLAELFLAAGDEVRAARYRTAAEIGTQHTLMRWRSRHILAAGITGLDRWDRRRAYDVLIFTCEAIRVSGPASEARTFADAATTLALSLTDLAHALVLRASFDHALKRRGPRTDLSTALRLYEEARDLNGQAAAHAGIGHIELWKSRFDIAASRYQRAHALYRKGGDRAWAASTRLLLARCLVGQGQDSAAAREIEGCIRESQAIEDARREGGARVLMANVLIRKGDFDAARASAQRALELATERHDGVTEYMARRELGLVGIKANDMPSARAEYGNALAVARRLKNPMFEAEARNVLDSLSS